jgi:TPP-dependent 2-oxoacid decarboxylase
MLASLIQARQLTVQELSTMIAQDLKPIIFVLNNKGYTIERYIHGKDRKYNDIVNWCVVFCVNHYIILNLAIPEGNGLLFSTHSAQDQAELNLIAYLPSLNWISFSEVPNS